MASSITPSQAAEIIGCTPAHVRSLIRSGAIKAREATDPHGNRYYLLSEAEAVKIKNSPHRSSRGRKAKR